MFKYNSLVLELFFWMIRSFLIHLVCLQHCVPKVQHKITRTRRLISIAHRIPPIEIPSYPGEASIFCTQVQERLSQVPEGVPESRKAHIALIKYLFSEDTENPAETKTPGITKPSRRMACAFVIHSLWSNVLELRDRSFNLTIPETWPEWDALTAGIAQALSSPIIQSTISYRLLALSFADLVDKHLLYLIFNLLDDENSGVPKDLALPFLELIPKIFSFLGVDFQLDDTVGLDDEEPEVQEPIAIEKLFPLRSLQSSLMSDALQAYEHYEGTDPGLFNDLFSRRILLSTGNPLTFPHNPSFRHSNAQHILNAFSNRVSDSASYWH